MEEPILVIDLYLTMDTNIVFTGLHLSLSTYIYVIFLKIFSLLAKDEAKLEFWL